MGSIKKEAHGTIKHFRKDGQIQVSPANHK